MIQTRNMARGGTGMVPPLLFAGETDPDKGFPLGGSCLRSRLMRGKMEEV